MKHRYPQQFRSSLRRPIGRVALVAAGVTVAGAVTGVSLIVAGGPDDRPVAPVRVAAAELAAPEAAPSTTAPAAAPATSSAAPEQTEAARKAAPTSAAPEPTESKPPTARTLKYDYQAQSTYYYCGPAATRIALTASGVRPSQDEVAAQLNTTESGTDSAQDTTRVLNRLAKTDFYSTREIPGTPGSGQIDRLQEDAVHAISTGHAMVANIVGSQVDTDGGWHDYSGGHYVAVVGYRDDGRVLKIADPAFVNGQSEYWVTTIDFANWMATRGYSA
ncbi:C39 family peptidase [Plantactinospora sp. KBS50]|uniref:C39 family peptidase n=1 Tax=Plantactinospora sp. KBS50 TaxID=2024580 RepID=UPI000BAB0848|nr:C39 family peptidase [Plantactinospora sp. KBS50]ASW54489.1 hypothetical protein CIK06_10270 [Plantactinospora sp. KBS50]